MKLVDRIGINHDIDDSVRAGVLDPADLPAREIAVLGPTGRRIDTLVLDLVERSAAAGDIVQSEEVGGAMLRLRKFMFQRVYLTPDAQRELPRGADAPGPFRALRPEPAGVLDPDATEQQRNGLPRGNDGSVCRAAFSELSVPQGF